MNDKAHVLIQACFYLPPPIPKSDLLAAAPTSHIPHFLWLYRGHLCCCHHRPLAAHQTFQDFYHSTKLFPALINSSPDKSRIGNPFVWTAILILSLRNMHLRISSNYCLLAFGLRSVWYDQTAKHVMTAPAPDCRIPKGTVYFFPK